jgi:hypothetical protein
LAFLDAAKAISDTLLLLKTFSRAWQSYLRANRALPYQEKPFPF